MNWIFGYLVRNQALADPHTNQTSGLYQNEDLPFVYQLLTDANKLESDPFSETGASTRVVLSLCFHRHALVLTGSQCESTSRKIENVANAGCDIIVSLAANDRELLSTACEQFLILL